MSRDRIPAFDLYAELEVARDASAETIEAAYRSLVKRHHPDVAEANGGGAKADGDDRIKRILLARQWLADPERRRRYDDSTRPATRRSSGGPSDARRAAERVVPTPPRWDEPDRTNFGLNNLAVRDYLAELRQLDIARATEVAHGKGIADAAGYLEARRAAFAASRKQRLSEWLFAREAASIIVRTRLGDASLTGQVVEPLADVAGAIAIRDLLSEAQLKLLLMPWTWRGDRVIGREPSTARAWQGPTRRPSASPPPTATAWAARRSTASPSPTPPSPTAPIPAPSPVPAASAVADPIPMPAPYWRVQRSSQAAWHRPRGSSPAWAHATAGAASAGAAAAGAAAGAAPAKPTTSPPPRPPAAAPRPRVGEPLARPRVAALGRRGRITAFALTSSLLVAVVAIGAIAAGIGLDRGPGDIAAVPGATTNGAQAGGPSSSAAIATPLPTLPFTGGIDPARLAALQAGAARTIERLAAAAKAGNVRAAQALLGDSAPHLDASGLEQATFPDVAARDIVVSGTDGHWLAFAAADTLTSTDGARWTFDYGERPIAVYARTSEHSMYFLSGGRREIFVRVASVTLTRSTAIVSLDWRFPTSADAAAYTGFGLTMSSLTMGQRSYTVSRGPSARLGGDATKATLTFSLRAIPASRGTIGVSVVYDPGGQSSIIVGTPFKLVIR